MPNIKILKINKLAYLQSYAEAVQGQLEFKKFVFKSPSRTIQQEIVLSKRFDFTLKFKTTIFRIFGEGRCSILYTQDTILAHFTDVIINEVIGVKAKG